LPRLRPASDTVRYDTLFSGPVRIAEYPRPMLSDEVETAQTVHMMDELADADAAHRLVIEATYRALDEAGRTLESSDYEKAVAVFWFLKRTIRYVPTPGTSPLVDQTLIPPATLLAMPDPEGDCPQFSMLASAMLRVLCVPCFYKTIAADQDYPDTYSHIYNVVRVGAGRFMPFDSSNGPEPGAEYSPAFKRRIWPQVLKTKCGRNRLGDAGDSVSSTIGSAVDSIPTTITPTMLGMIGLSIGALWYYSHSGKGRS
jgi:transglutaminase-like putative cysteine protease